MRLAAAVALALLAPLVAPVDGAVVTQQPKNAFMSVPEMIKVMKASPVHYKVNAIEKLADVPQDKLKDALWPQRVEPVELPKVTRTASGKFGVSAWPVKPAALRANDQAEKLFGAKNFKGAAEQYRKAIAADPGFYLAYANLGDCLLFGARDPEAALVQYQKALELNPDDYRLHFFRGNTLLALGRKQEAAEAFVTSLVLQPRNPLLLQKLRKEGTSLGIHVQEELLAPRGFARHEGAVVAIYADPDKAYWLSWASCKGFWLGEPSHRKQILGRSEPGWSSLEELECLAGLVDGHLSMVERDEVALEPPLKKLESVVKEGLADAFVVYELGSRLDPQMTLKLERDFYPELRRYVRKYVLGMDDAKE